MDKQIVNSSMVFYESFYDAASDLSDEGFREVWSAICEYAFYGIQPEGLSAVAKALFKVMKPNIDNIVKQREAGQNGGRPKKPRVMESKTPGYESKNPGLSDAKPMVTKSKTLPIYDVDVDVDVDKDVDVDGDVVVDVDEHGSDAVQKNTDNTTLTPISETEPTEYGRIPLTTEIALAFAKANYKPGPGEMERFVKYNRERKWKMPLEESVPRWIANEKKKEKKRVNFDQHEYDFNEIDMALLQKQMDLPPMEGRDA